MNLVFFIFGLMNVPLPPVFGACERRRFRFWSLWTSEFVYLKVYERSLQPQFLELMIVGGFGFAVYEPCSFWTMVFDTPSLHRGCVFWCRGAVAVLHAVKAFVRDFFFFFEQTLNFEQTLFSKRLFGNFANRPIGWPIGEILLSKRHCVCSEKWLTGRLNYPVKTTHTRVVQGPSARPAVSFSDVLWRTDGAEKQDGTLWRKVTVCDKLSQFTHMYAYAYTGLGGGILGLLEHSPSCDSEARPWGEGWDGRLCCCCWLCGSRQPRRNTEVS